MVLSCLAFQNDCRCGCVDAEVIGLLVAIDEDG